MLKFITTNWQIIVPITLSVVSLIFSKLSWHKNRIVYSIETVVLRQPTGSKDDIINPITHINEKLSSGKFMILGFSQRTKSDNDREIFLGRIKK